MNIEVFNGFHGVKYAYTSSTNGVTHGKTVIFSSNMHWPHIYSLKCAKMRLGAGSEAPEGVKIRKY